MKKITVSFVALAVAAAGFSAANAQALPTRVKIASHYIEATGCHDTTQSFTTQVPNPEQLNRSYHGVLDGIEVVETAANNGHSYSNFTWVNNGTAITYRLYAKGAGHWVDPPVVFGVKVGGGLCAGAAGGSEGIEITRITGGGPTACAIWKGGDSRLFGCFAAVKRCCDLPAAKAGEIEESLATLCRHRCGLLRQENPG